MASLRSGDPWLAGLTLATCAAVLTVIPLRRPFEARRILDGPAPRVRIFERWFERLSWFVRGGVGPMAARAVLAPDDGPVHLMLKIGRAECWVWGVQDG